MADGRKQRMEEEDGGGLNIKSTSIVRNFRGCSRHPFKSPVSMIFLHTGSFSFSVSHSLVHSAAKDQVDAFQGQPLLLSHFNVSKSSMSPSGHLGPPSPKHPIANQILLALIFKRSGWGPLSNGRADLAIVGIRSGVRPSPNSFDRLVPPHAPSATWCRA